jgi:hypothetical protein
MYEEKVNRIREFIEEEENISYVDCFEICKMLHEIEIEKLRDDISDEKVSPFEGIEDLEIPDNDEEEIMEECELEEETSVVEEIPPNVIMPEVTLAKEGGEDERETDN